LDINKYIPVVGNYHRLPSTAMLSGRGCPYLCTFCSRTGIRDKHNVRFRSPENVVAEIEHCIKKYGIRDFRFYDDTLVVPRKRIVDLCNLIIKKKLKISFNCFARVDTVDLSLLKLMRKAGCYHIKYGLESGSNETLKKIKKFTTTEQARKAIKWTKQCGMAAKASFILGFPDETIEEIKQTVEFAKEIMPSYVTFGIFTPLPGSELFDEAKANNQLVYHPDTGYYTIKNQVDAETINRIIKKAYRDIYLHPRSIVDRIVYLIRNFNLYEIGALYEGVKMLF
jgi:radical SAM superfamily enzyme YgiQ (UPF0313 family)